MTSNRAPNLPSARPSHYYGKVLRVPPIARPVFNENPPQLGASAAPAPAPGSVGDVMAQLAAILKQTVSKNVQLQLPDFYPIPTAVFFQLAGTATTSGAGTITQIGGTLKLPPGTVALIHTVNISVLTTLTTATNQTWAVLINGSPAPGWAGVTFAGRGAQNLERGFDAAIRVPNGATISIAETNVDGGTYTVGADVTGWYYTIADAVRWVRGRGQLISN